MDEEKKKRMLETMKHLEANWDKNWEKNEDPLEGTHIMRKALPAGTLRKIMKELMRETPSTSSEKSEE